jgi:hypothetical protein
VGLWLNGNRLGGGFWYFQKLTGCFIVLDKPWGLIYEVPVYWMCLFYVLGGKNNKALLILYSFALILKIKNKRL